MQIFVSGSSSASKEVPQQVKVVIPTSYPGSNTVLSRSSLCSISQALEWFLFSVYVRWQRTQCFLTRAWVDRGARRAARTSSSVSDAVSRESRRHSWSLLESEDLSRVWRVDLGVEGILCEERRSLIRISPRSLLPARTYLEGTRWQRVGPRMNAVTLITVSFTFNLRQHCVDAEGIDFKVRDVHFGKNKGKKRQRSGGEKPMNKQDRSQSMSNFKHRMWQSDYYRVQALRQFKRGRQHRPHGSNSDCLIASSLIGKNTHRKGEQGIPQGNSNRPLWRRSGGSEKTQLWCPCTVTWGSTVFEHRK